MIASSVSAVGRGGLVTRDALFLFASFSFIGVGIADNRDRVGVTDLLGPAREGMDEIFFSCSDAPRPSDKLDRKIPDGRDDDDDSAEEVDGLGVECSRDDTASESFEKILCEW